MNWKLLLLLIGVLIVLSFMKAALAQYFTTTTIPIANGSTASTGSGIVVLALTSVPT